MQEISRVNYKRCDLLYEFPAETRLTVYRRLDIEQEHSQWRVIRKQWLSRGDLGPHQMMNYEKIWSS